MFVCLGGVCKGACVENIAFFETAGVATGLSDHLAAVKQTVKSSYAPQQRYPTESRWRQQWKLTMKWQQLVPIRAPRNDLKSKRYTEQLDHILRTHTTVIISDVRPTFMRNTPFFTWLPAHRACFRFSIFLCFCFCTVTCTIRSDQWQ